MEKKQSHTYRHVRVATAASGDCDRTARLLSPDCGILSPSLSWARFYLNNLLDEKQLIYRTEFQPQVYETT